MAGAEFVAGGDDRSSLKGRLKIHDLKMTDRVAKNNGGLENDRLENEGLY